MVLASEELALLNELAGAGYALRSIWDWVNAPVYAPDALPILIRHLERAQDENLIEGIARALSDRRYRKAERALVRKFAEVETSSVRWAIGNAITIVGFRNSAEQILAYCANARFGPSRELLVGELYRIKRPEVEPLLLSLLDDPVLDYFAASALGRCGGHRSLERLEAMDLAGRSPRTRKKVPKVIARLRSKLAAA